MKLTIQDVKGIAKSRYWKTKTKTYITALLWVSFAFLVLAGGYAAAYQINLDNSATAYQVESTGLLTVGNNHVMLEGKYLTPEDATTKDLNALKYPALIFFCGFIVTFIYGIFEMSEEEDKFKANFVQHYVDTGELLEK